jgi:hypothetical protein
MISGWQPSCHSFAFPSRSLGTRQNNYERQRVISPVLCIPKLELGNEVNCVWFLYTVIFPAFIISFIIIKAKSEINGIKSIEINQIIDSQDCHGYIVFFASSFQQ